MQRLHQQLGLAAHQVGNKRAAGEYPGQLGRQGMTGSRRAQLLGQRVTGALENALQLADEAGRRPVAIPGREAPFHVGPLVVLIGPETASSGEILAALLRRYAGAELRGARTAGKDYLLRVVPVDHDWQLLLPSERVEVPGERLAGGLAPDGPLPPVPASDSSSTSTTVRKS